MSRATKTDRVVAKILGALRDEPETEEAMLNWLFDRYGEALEQRRVKRIAEKRLAQSTRLEGGA